MTDNFDRSIAFVLKHEGGYVNDPQDAGGETKYGISKRAYPTLDIKALNEDAAKAIYRTDYWQKANCHVLEWPMCLVVFDTAVNMGVARAQDLRGKAFNQRQNYSFNWTDYLFLRIEHYNQIAAKGENIKFLRGWLNRMIDLWRTAKA